MASVRRNDDTGSVEITSGNFAAVDAYEPGSVAKVITVAAALNEGAVTPDTGFDVPWRKLVRRRPAGRRAPAPRRVADGRADPHRVVEHRHDRDVHGRRSGRQKHWEYMRRFGLGEATALDFPGESPGILKHWKDLWGSERVTVAYGQGVVEHVDPARRRRSTRSPTTAPTSRRSSCRSTVGADGDGDRHRCRRRPARSSSRRPPRRCSS